MVLEMLQQRINALLVLHDMNWKDLGKKIRLPGMHNFFDEPNRRGRPSHLAYLDNISKYKVFPAFIPVVLYDGRRMANGGDEEFPQGKYVPNYIGRTWKQTRKTKGVDLLAVAADLKIPYLTLTGYEAGSALPKFSRSTAINEYLGLEERYFVPVQDMIAIQTEEEAKTQSLELHVADSQLELITDVPIDISDDEMIELAYHNEQPDRGYDFAQFVSDRIGLFVPQSKQPIYQENLGQEYKNRNGILTSEDKVHTQSDFNINIVLDCFNKIFSK